MLLSMGMFTLIEERDGVLRAEVVERTNGETRTLALFACALGPASESAARELLRIAIEGGLVRGR